MQIEMTLSTCATTASLNSCGTQFVFRLLQRSCCRDTWY